MDAEHRVRGARGDSLRAGAYLIAQVRGMFARIGERGYFLRDIGRGIKDPATYGTETIRQMRNIGVDSLPLTAIVAAFI